MLRMLPPAEVGQSVTKARARHGLGDVANSSRRIESLTRPCMTRRLKSICKKHHRLRSIPDPTLLRPPCPKKREAYPKDRGVSQPVFPSPRQPRKPSKEPDSLRRKDACPCSPLERYATDEAGMRKSYFATSAGGACTADARADSTDSAAKPLISSASRRGRTTALRGSCRKSSRLRQNRSATGMCW